MKKIKSEILISQNVSISLCARDNSMKTSQLTARKMELLTTIVLNIMVKCGFKTNCQAQVLFLLLSSSSNWVKLMRSTMPVLER